MRSLLTVTVSRRQTCRAVPTRDIKSSRPTRPKFFGLGLVVSGLGLVLGLVQRAGLVLTSCGLVVNHENLVMNESQPSVTEYLSASSSEYSHSCQ